MSVSVRTLVAFLEAMRDTTQHHTSVVLLLQLGRRVTICFFSSMGRSLVLQVSIMSLHKERLCLQKSVLHIVTRASLTAMLSQGSTEARNYRYCSKHRFHGRHILASGHESLDLSISARRRLAITGKWPGPLMQTQWGLSRTSRAAMMSAKREVEELAGCE